MRTSWNKGMKIDRKKYPSMGHFKKHTEKSNKKNSLSHLGKKTWQVGLTKKKDSRIYAGERHHNWKGGVTKESEYQRKLFHKNIQKQVFKRDNYTCQLCGTKEDLQVDHIQSWAEYVELRFCIDNCRTLCKSCHYQITYGKPIPDKKMEWGHNLGRARIEL